MTKNLSLILVLLLSFSAFAAESTPIKKGEQSPYDGIVLTTKKAQSIRKELIEKDQLKIFTQSLLENEGRYKKIISNQNEQIVILTDHTEKLVKIAEESQTVTVYEKVLWFGLGVVATSFAVYGAGQLVK
jgi:hypothetical protein